MFRIHGPGLKLQQPQEFCGEDAYVFKGTCKKKIPLISKRKQASKFLGFSMLEGKVEPVYTANH